MPFLADGGVNSNYGLLAFDNSDCQQVAADGTTYCANEVGATNRMIALRPGSPAAPPCPSCSGGTGIIQGIGIESAVLFPAPTTLNEDLVPLLGTVTVSAESLDHTAAQIYFFDAVGLRILNEAPAIGILYGVTLVAGPIQAVIDGGNGGLTPYVPANVGVGLYPYTETFQIVNQGNIPGLSYILTLPYDGGMNADGSYPPVLAWPVPDAGAPIAATSVEVNDKLYPINLSGTLCLVDNGEINPYFAVLGVDDGGANIFTTSTFQYGFLDGGTIVHLSDCPGASGYIVAAGAGTEFPFLVEGSISGLLGRMQAGPADGGPPPIFQVPNAVTNARGLSYARYYNPSVDAGVVIDNDAGTVGGVPTLPLTLQLPYQGPSSDFLYFVGSYYLFVLSSGIIEAAAPLDAVGLGYAGLFLPGGVASTRVIDALGENTVDIIAYPSSNTVIDFVPNNILLNLPNSAAITVHF